VANPYKEDDVRPELHRALAREEWPLAEIVLGELDGRGRLSMPLAEIARIGHSTEDRVARVIETLRATTPVGTAALTLRDSLLLQIRALNEKSDVARLAEVIIDRHLADLAAGRISRIARSEATSTEKVREARDFIRDNLDPQPGAVLDAARDDARPITPDIEFLENEGRLEPLILERERTRLRISPLYEQLLDRERESSTSTMSESDRSHVLTHARDAQNFLGRVRRRWQMLERLAWWLIGRQEGLIKKGPLHANSTTRAEAAADLGVHESTLSRAVANRYVTLPSSKVIPMSDFFDPALRAKAALGKLVREESQPHSDAQLAQALQKDGVHVSRRTVAKYRSELRILPHHLR
jgi:RNA polymerase sigma-54 factor